MYMENFKKHVGAFFVVCLISAFVIQPIIIFIQDSDIRLVPILIVISLFYLVYRKQNYIFGKIKYLNFFLEKKYIKHKYQKDVDHLFLLAK